tara:strand:+ start:5456 stop:5719 length:264 start_codon:yes stop_codon:yes gene_type:complete
VATHRVGECETRASRTTRIIDAAFRRATRARVDARAVSHGRATTWCARTTRRDDANDGDDGDDANDGARAARRRARDDDGATTGRRG